MAGVSMKAIKTRIKSMQSTRQITKAMELVAASKLRSAQNRAIAARPYSEALYAAMGEIAASGLDLDSPYLRPRPAGKPLYVVIAGDRGLAGGYNSNILKLAWARMEGTDCVVLPIGRKAAEFFTHRGCDILTDSFREASALTIGGCYTIARLLPRVPERAVLRGIPGLHPLCLPPVADARAAAAAAAVRHPRRRRAERLASV